MQKSQKLKLTDASVKKALKDRSQTAVYRDTEVKGLILRVGSRNATYSLDYRRPGKRPDGSRWPSQTFKIGSPESHSVADARKVAAGLKVKVHDGDDPASIRKAKNAESSAKLASFKTVGELVEDYIAGNLQNKSNHHVTQRGALRVAIKEMNVAGLGPDAVSVASILELLRLHGSRPRAKHRFGSLSRFFDDLVSRELVSSNPCLKVPKTKRPKPAAPRNRYHTASEVHAMFNATGLPEHQLLFLRCAIYLPLRLGELANLQGEHVDVANGRLLLPAKMMKNGDPFSIPVPAPVFDLLKASNIKLTVGERVFGLTKSAKRFSGHSALTKRICEASGVEDFNFHNLRRTFFTTLAEMGVGDSAVTDSLLCHRQSATRSGVIAAYNHAGLWSQKVSTMDAWATLVGNAAEYGTWQASGDVVRLSDRVRG